MDKLKTQSNEKLLQAYMLCLDCFIKRLEYLADNITEGRDPLGCFPFIESVPGKLETLTRVAQQLGILDNQ